MATKTGKKSNNPEGRPPIWDSVIELQRKIDEYFHWIKGEYTDVPDELPESLEAEESETTKVWERNPEPATITGLAIFLGFNSRQSLYNYEAKPEFLDTIKKARLRVEHSYEKQLYSKSPVGSIFALKNMGWSDKQEVEHSGDMVNVIWNSPTKKK